MTMTLTDTTLVQTLAQMILIVLLVQIGIQAIQVVAHTTQAVPMIQEVHKIQEVHTTRRVQVQIGKKIYLKYMFRPNSLFYTDGYKIGHKKMLAKGTTRLYGTWIPRSTKHAPKGVTKIVSFGQQLVVKWLHDEFAQNFFSLTRDEAMKFGKDMSMYLGMDYDASHFGELHDLGYLPIRIKALPEGIETNPNIPHMMFNMISWCRSCRCHWMVWYSLS